MKLKKIENLITEYAKSTYRELKVKAKRDSNSGIAITVSQMYNYVDFDFEFLSRLSEIFKTKNINIGNRNHSDGCETCDYGSKYELTLYIYDVGIDIED